MTSVVTRPDSNYERLPDDVRSVLSDRLQQVRTTTALEQTVAPPADGTTVVATDSNTWPAPTTMMRGEKS